MSGGSGRMIAPSLSVNKDVSWTASYYGDVGARFVIVTIAKQTVVGTVMSNFGLSWPDEGAGLLRADCRR
jgi:hypothetical protein